MSIISTNFLVARVAAFFLIFLVSSAVTFFSGVFFEFTLFWMSASGLILSAFLGAFNVFEPKAVDMEYQKIKKMIENFEKD